MNANYSLILLEKQTRVWIETKFQRWHVINTYEMNKKIISDLQTRAAGNDSRVLTWYTLLVRQNSTRILHPGALSNTRVKNDIFSCFGFLANWLENQSKGFSANQNNNNITYYLWLLYCLSFKFFFDLFYHFNAFHIKEQNSCNFQFFLCWYQYS